MKVTKYQKTYRLTINQREAYLLLGALYNSAAEDIDQGPENPETQQEGFEKDKLWHELVAVAGH